MVSEEFEWKMLLSSWNCDFVEVTWSMLQIVHHFCFGFPISLFPRVIEISLYHNNKKFLCMQNKNKDEMKKINMKMRIDFMNKKSSSHHIWISTTFFRFFCSWSISLIFLTGQKIGHSVDRSNFTTNRKIASQFQRFFFGLFSLRCLLC